jgi:hypothetical protein
MASLLLLLHVWRITEEDKESVFDCVLRELVENERVINGQDQQTSMIIVDSISVKNTDTAKAEGI